nr:MAG TPA: hypothetical protein [Caudoviricetes sp.]
MACQGQTAHKSKRAALRQRLRSKTAKKNFSNLHWWDTPTNYQSSLSLLQRPIRGFTFGFSLRRNLDIK